VQDARKPVREFPAILRVDDRAITGLVKLGAIAVEFHLVNPAVSFERAVAKDRLGGDDEGGWTQHSGDIAVSGAPQNMAEGRSLSATCSGCFSQRNRILTR